jgi:hypothetical protein
MAAPNTETAAVTPRRHWSAIARVLSHPVATAAMTPKNMLVLMMAAFCSAVSADPVAWKNRTSKTPLVIIAAPVLAPAPMLESAVPTGSEVGTRYM